MLIKLHGGSGGDGSGDRNKVRIPQHVHTEGPESHEPLSCKVKCAHKRERLGCSHVSEDAASRKQGPEV